MHRGASWTMVGQKNTIVHGGPAFLKGWSRLGLSLS